MSITGNQLSTLHISDVYKIVLDKFGLKFRGTYKVRDVIKGITEAGFEISTLRGVKFPNEIGILNIEIENHQRFFGSVLFETDEERNNFKQILEFLNLEYVIDELEIPSPNTSGITTIIIRGIHVTEDVPSISQIRRTEIVRVNVPY